MNASEVRLALAAAMSEASALGLRADEAVLIQNSNRLAVRLLPCDALARIAKGEHTNAAFEVEVARRLTEAGSPVGTLEDRVEPRVYLRAGFAITLWTYYPPLQSQLAPRDYATALEQLHAGMRQIELPALHFTDRVANAQRLLDNPADTPQLPPAVRELLSDTLRDMQRAICERGAAEQLLHGEPHPGNLLPTEHGPRFIDLETCCRGPVEFDLAHAPEEVSELYPAANQDLLRECRILMLAMIITWRWDRTDQFPNGRHRGEEWLAQLRTALQDYGARR
ncbi:MAG: phosphotransferase [Tepidiformaceae bacterium]